MSQPNRKYKRLEALLSESKPAEPNPIAQPDSGDVDALKARVASLQAELEENRKKQAEAREAHPAGQSGMAEKKASMYDRETASRSLSAKESQAAAAKQNSMNDQPSRLQGKSSPARNAYRVLLALFAAQFMVVGFLVYLTIQTPTWQLWVMDLLGGGLMMSEIFGLIQTRRGRHEFGIKFFLSFFMVVLFVIPFMYSGMGLLFLVSALTFTLLIASQTLPPRQSTLFVRIGTLVGVISLLVDLYIPIQRTALPGFQNVLYFALAFILPVFGYAILREFRDYSLRTKLVLGFVSILLLAGIVAALAIRQQFRAAEQTAVAEAGSVAETLGGVVVRNQVELQELIQQFHDNQQREARVIDLNQRILASIIPESIGTIYDADQHDEVTATLKDGQSRAFLETSAEYPQGLNLVVVPVKDEQTSIITGAVLLDYTQALQLASFAEADSFSREVRATITKDPSDLQNFISALSTARDQDLVVIDLQKQILADAKPENVGKTYNQDLGGEVAATLQDGQPRAFVEINVEHPRGIQQVVTPLKNLSGQIIGATVVGTSPESEQAAIAQAVQIAQTIGTAVSQNQTRLQGLITQMSETQQRDVKVIGTDLRILADAVPQNIGTIFAADQNSEVAATLSDGQSRTFVEVTKDNPQGIRHLVLPIKDESGGIISAVILDYTSIYDELQESANTATRSLIGFGLAGLLLAFVISQIISTSIANPISKLSDAASKIGEGHLDTPIPAQTSQDEVGTLAGAFASMTTQLRGLIENMEQRVADRTHDLELAAVVVRTVTEKVSNVDDMLSEATELIRSSFDLYYTQVYLLDPTGHTITLRAGTGDVGQQLLRRGHHLLVNSGSLNGRAVSEKKPIIVADTAMNRNFLPNPLLPNTRSEMVVPLIVSGRVLGVLDMQSEIPGALNQSNLPALAALAGQISIAIQNAALFAQSEESRKQMEENVRQITTAGWLDFLNGIDRGEKIGYVFDQTEVKAIERESNAQSITGLSVPITVTGATVGKIQVAQEEREWTSSETEIVQSTADQLAQHIENLRLLAQTEKYRQEAVQTTRRLTRIGWEGYLETRNALAAGYSFNPNEVKAEYQEMVMDPSSTLSLPINVRDETIGELMINADNSDPGVVNEIFSAIAAQLGDHIENLRLLETTEYELAERTRTEQELLKVRLGMDRANDAVFITETDGSIIYVNAAFERIYGWKADEAIGQTPRILKSGLIPAEQYTHFWGALQNNQVVAGEIVNKTKAGRLIPIEGNNNPIVNADGKIIGFIGMHRDITDRKRAEEIIAQRANQLETVATVSSTAATVLDPDKLLQTVVDITKERFKVYHTHIYLTDDSWNTLLLSAGAGEIGRQMVAKGHAIQINAEGSLVARATRERKTIIVNDVRSEDGFLPEPMLPETRSEMAVPMIAGDKVIGVFDVQADTVGHFTDEDANIYTTLASQVAVALQNARLYVEQAATVTQLRELDRLKSAFLANMSHELRTPLNSILGFADVILEGLDGPLTDNMSNDLGLIQKNGQHLLHLINDVLDMAKIDSGKMNLKVEKFKVHELLTDVTDITSMLAKEKSLALIIEPDSDREIEINADKVRLRQVMINLVNNAMKFTEKGRISIRVIRENKNVLISVKDTGIGISKDNLEAVFQEFTQLDTTTTRKAGGTGLGLPISRRLINMHSGRLWAESKGINGKGSTFYVTLPIDANINEFATLTT